MPMCECVCVEKPALLSEVMASPCLEHPRVEQQEMGGVVVNPGPHGHPRILLSAVLQVLKTMRMLGSEVGRACACLWAGKSTVFARNGDGLTH